MVIDQVLESMPFSMHAVAAFSLLIGVVILVFGRRLLKPGLVLVSLVAGAAAGLIVGSLLPYDWSIWWPIGIGAGLFALVAIAAYRFVMAFVLAVALGTAAPLGFFTYAQLTGMYEGQPGSPLTDEELQLPGLKEQIERLDKITKAYQEKLAKIEKGELKPSEGEAAVEGDPQAPDAQHEWRRRLDAIVQAVASTAADQWQDAPGREKALVTLCALGGIGSGVLIGVLVPTLAGAVSSSLAGSMIILVSGYWLAIRTKLPVESVAPDSPAKWLAMWLVLAIIGLGIQFSLGRKKADKSA